MKGGLVQNLCSTHLFEGFHGSFAFVLMADWRIGGGAILIDAIFRLVGQPAQAPRVVGFLKRSERDEEAKTDARDHPVGEVFGVENRKTWFHYDQLCCNRFSREPYSV